MFKGHLGRFLDKNSGEIDSGINSGSNIDQQSAVKANWIGRPVCGVQSLTYYKAILQPNKQSSEDMIHL